MSRYRIRVKGRGQEAEEAEFSDEGEEEFADEQNHLYDDFDDRSSNVSYETGLIFHCIKAVCLTRRQNFCLVQIETNCRQNFKNSLIPLPDDKIFVWSKLKQIADEILKFIDSITRRQNFRLVQIETNCRQHFKVHSKWKISTI